MRQIILILLLSSCVQQLAAQAKHELKISSIALFNAEILPTYEILSNNEKIGLELGFGMDFKKVNLGVGNDFFIVDPFTESPFGNPTEFKHRSINSMLSLKFYKSVQRKNLGIGLSVGPYVTYDQSIFYDEAFLSRQEELLGLGLRSTDYFVGQREVENGVNTGIKFLIKSKLVIETNVRMGILFVENVPGKIEYKENYSAGGFSILLGYRFGKKTKYNK